MKKTIVEERIAWSWEDKEHVLKKSKGRCCHCGKSLDKYAMTMDHYIPLSKGGTNDLTNIVALCYDCNQDKDNKVVYPFDFYRYLGMHDIIELMGIKKRYEKNGKWNDTKTFMREDAVIVRYTSRHNVFKSFKKGGYACGVPMCVKLEKAVYSDLDEIYKKTSKYNNKYGLSTENLKEDITDVFSKGAIYKIVKGCEIVGIIPITIRQVENGTKLKYQYCIEGLPCYYQKPENQDMLYRCLNKLAMELGSLHPCKVALINIYFPKSDLFLVEMFRQYGNFYPTPSPESCYCVEFYGIMEDEERVGHETYREWQLKEDEIKEQYSNFIRKAFELKRCMKKDNRNKIVKKKKKREYDEYDIEYYKSS